MEGGTSYLSLLTVVLLALLVPALTTQIRAIRIPIVVGEIVAGIIVGQSGLRLVSAHDPWLTMLSTLGFSFLMFLAGLELDIDVLRNGGQQGSGEKPGRLSPVILGIGSFVLTLGMAFGISSTLTAIGLVRDPLLMTLVLSTTSLGLVLPTLKERRETRTVYGQAILLASLTADFATMILISIYVIFHTNGLTLQMLVVLVILALFFAFYRLAQRAQRHPPLESFFRRVGSAASHIPMRGAMAISLVFIAFAQQLGVEVILGAFLGGALVALLDPRESSPLREQLDVMGFGFFIPIFFITVGVNFDLRAILGSRQVLTLVPLLIVAAYLIKLVSGLLFRLNFDWRRTFGAGILLSSRLSLIIAASAIALELGVITSGVNSAIILVALVTCTVSPLLFNRIVPSGTETPPELTVVVGNDAEALALAERLARREQRVKLAYLDGTASGAPGAGASRAGLQPVPLAGVSEDSIRALGGCQAHTLVALLGDDTSNLRLCQVARVSCGVPNVVARVNKPANLEAYTAIGVVPVSAWESEISALENLTLNPNIYKLLSTPAAGREISELEVMDLSCNGTPLHELRLPGAALIIVLQRAGEFIVPRGNTRLELGDRVTVLANSSEMEEVRALLTGERGNVQTG